jgi:uncharacterized protein YdeI (YjbR/CyaY-like superfamily)
MPTLNPQVDPYFSAGCGRCPLGGTPQCKVHRWPAELEALRRIVLDCGLTEALKWGVPCYTFDHKNIAIVSAFNDYCALSFFKGALLEDTHGILHKPGEHSESGRLIKFTNLRDILEMEPILQEYLYEAVEIEKAGLKVTYKKPEELPMPEELRQMLETLPEFKAAFFALTPGRQKGYLLHFLAPKQSVTRTARIEKCVQRILEGKGVNDY